MAAGFALAVMPALGASKAVTNNGDTWTPSAVEVEVGDEVTFTWTGSHNVLFEDGDRSGNVTLPTGGDHERTFDAVGTFRFRCEARSTDFAGGMVGSVTVKPTTTTTETATTNPARADITAPTISRLGRRAGRKALIVTFRSSEDGEAAAVVRRREPRSKRLRVIVRRSAGMSVGPNVWTLQRAPRGLRRGGYRVTLVFTDEAGNATPPRTLVFKIS